MDSFQEDITALRNFKSKYKLNEMIVHFHERNMDTPHWVYVSSSVEKLIKGSQLSYMLWRGDIETGLFPVITNTSLYLIELKTDGNDILNDIEYYKKRVFEIKNKLNSKQFLEKAPVDIIEKEKNKLLIFERKWELASLGYTFV